MVRHSVVTDGSIAERRSNARRAAVSDLRCRRDVGSVFADQRALSVLEDNQKRLARLRSGRRLRELVLVALALGMFAWGTTQLPVLCLLGYLALFAAPLLRHPAGPATWTRNRRGRTSIAERSGGSGVRRCRGHRGGH
jgi:hypothetical protein